MLKEKINQKNTGVKERYELLREISDLEDPIKIILKKLKEENIDLRSFDVIVGDDASGRIPALVFGKLIKKLGKNIETKFVACHKRWNIDYSEYEFALAKMKLKNKMVLIVSDMISTGEHLDDLTRALRNNQINYKVVSIGFKPLENLRPSPEIRIKSPIFFGSSTMPSVFGKSEISGVEKDIFPVEKIKLTSRALRGKDRKVTTIKRTREDINKLVSKIEKYYKFDL